LSDSFWLIERVLDEYRQHALMVTANLLPPEWGKGKSKQCASMARASF